MLVIRAEQMEAFRLAQIERLKKDLYRHIQKSWPQKAGEQGENGVHEMIDLALERSDFYVIQKEVDIHRYINLMYALGPNFDDEEWAVKILEKVDESISERIDAICIKALEAGH